MTQNQNQSDNKSWGFERRFRQFDWIEGFDDTEKELM